MNGRALHTFSINIEYGAIDMAKNVNVKWNTQMEIERVVEHAQ